MGLKKTLVLCILDGFAVGNPSPHNAFHLAKTPNINHLITSYPHCLLQTSGLAVGLPEGQMGNSEVGHMTIGAGRAIKQNLVQINDELHSKNCELIEKITRKKPKKAHIIGIAAEGGVHGHADHIYRLAKILSEHKISTSLHLINDGRDTPPNNGAIFLPQLTDKCQKLDGVKVATICGRYYAMDRDGRTERTATAYNLYKEAKGNRCKDIAIYLRQKYSQNIFDEVTEPLIMDSDFCGIEDGDLIIFSNFRSDRMRQIVTAFAEDTERQNCHIITMVDYFSFKIYTKIETLFNQSKPQKTLPEILSNNNKKQLRVAETEKYAHITFFFNGGTEEIMKGEQRILIPSPKIANYDKMPEMSSYAVAEAVISGVQSGNYDFILVNFANCDMVGHTGNLQATVAAVEHLDVIVGKLMLAIKSVDATLIITADHGNIEEMIDCNGVPHTQHTTGPVDCFLYSQNHQHTILKNGSLCDIAPTILQLMQLSIPSEMSGNSLLS